MLAVNLATKNKGIVGNLIGYCEVCILFVLLIFASGCNVFEGNSNNSQEPDPQPIVIAPTAAFSQSVQSGKAALLVEFTDNSTAGSSAITSWAWQFGDDQTSIEQNPQHTYDMAGSYDVSLTVTSVDGTDTLVESQAVTVQAADIKTVLSVVDAKGLPVDDVIFSTTSFQIENTANVGTGYQLDLRPSEQSGVVQVNKSGYLQQVVYFDMIQVDQTKLVTLMKKSEPIMFDTLVGGKFSAKDGASVSIPADALVKPDGSLANGMVELYITPIDISDSIEVAGFPGSFYGAQELGAANEVLLSYGVVDITFEQDGEVLQLKDGEIAELNLPLYATKNVEDENLAFGDTIPVWYLDEQTGIWIYQSEGTVVADATSPNGLAIAAQTTHFTAFNIDINPPRLGGSTGENDPDGNLCNLTIQLIGAEVGEFYQYTLNYSRPGWPSSSNSRAFMYDGSAITQTILKGANITATVSKGGLEGSASFICDASGEVNTTITLGGQPPQFIEWTFRSIPNFTLSNSNIYEIKSNKIFIGGYFVGTPQVIITSDFLEMPVILGRGIYHQVDYQQTDPAQIDFTGLIANDFGSAELTTGITFVDVLAPITGYAYAFYQAEFSRTRIDWYEVEGADNIRIYWLDQDPESPGVLLADTPLSPSSSSHDLAGEYTGYLRLEFDNQYGTSLILFQINGPDCPPFTDLCSTN